MRYLLAALFSMGLCMSYSQPGKLFKSAPHAEQDAPQWVQWMYADSPNVWQVRDAYQEYYNTHTLVKTTHTQNYKYWIRNVLPYTKEDGRVEFPSFSTQLAEEAQYDSLRATANGERGNGWTCIGPFETKATGSGEPVVSWQGNVYCMDIYSGNSSVLYCGTESGGIFKTTDKGIHWTWASLNQTFTTIHAVKIHPANADIVFAGDGQKIYRTLDGGLNWSVVYSQGSLGVNDISINSLDPNIVLAGCDYGLFRSIDGGNNWTQVYSQACWDIELRPTNANIVYLLKSNPVAKRCEFFRSEDRGITFTLQDTGWYNSTDAARTDDGARMTVTPADTGKIYCVLIGNSKAGDMNYIGVYRSDDGGSHWTNPRGQDGGPYSNSVYNLATIDETSGFEQGYYNLSLAASHTDPNTIFVGCLSMSKSTDGAATFSYVGGYHGNTDWMHPDQQDIKISGQDQWVANDGGIAYSTDNFATIESRKNGITASDFWGFGSGWNEDILVGGRYHNGNTGRKSTYPSGQYHRLGGAEAPTGYVNPGSEHCYFSDISTKVLGAYYNEPAQSVGNMSLYPNEKYFQGESSEVEFHPCYYNTLYLGNGNKIYRSTDGGNSFDSLYAFGTNTTRPVMQIEVSRSNPQVIYAYAMQTNTLAKLLKSTDGGATWVVKDFPSGITSAVSGSITMSATDENKLWVCFGHNTNSNKVFVTYDGGTTWQNLTSAILNGHRTVNIVHQLGTASLVYLATNKAVFYRDSTMNDWQLFNTGLPGTASSNLMKIFYKTGKLRLSTYGHGLWETDLTQPSVPLAQPTVDKRTSYCSRDTFYFDSYSVLHQANATFLWSFSPAPVYVSSLTARNPKVIFGSTGSYQVSLTVNDGNTSDSKVIPNMVTVFPSLCNADTVAGYALSVVPDEGYAVTAPLKIGALNAITFSAWVKPNGTQSNYAGVMFADNDGGCGLNFKQNNRLGYHWAGASGSWSWNSGPIIDSNAWNHVALVITPDSATIYWNGVGYTRVASHGAVEFTAPLKIGRDRYWTDRTFNGWIDEVSVYNRALSRNEIRELRHLTRNPQTDPSLVAYYQFNEAEGAVLDKAGVTHAALLSDASRVVSSAPVGGGVAQRMSVNTDAAVALSAVSAVIDFKTASSSPQGEIVLTRLHVLPYASPDTFTAAPHTYFVLNNYGTNQTQLDLDSITLSNLMMPSQYAGNPSVFEIHSRAANAEGNWMSNGIHPQSANTYGGFSLQFGDNTNQHFNPAGQWVITHSFVSSVSDAALMGVEIFPNPASQDDVLQVRCESLRYTLNIYDAAGRLVLEKHCRGNETLQQVFKSSGVYTARITSEKGSSAVRLVVH
ncbi:MAG: T9SS type A sorting domain-containing protein [Bacteroidetes bacterium]|nr:T9SS type A sorting domain-containing protein [Bacteroidota bacterium]